MEAGALESWASTDPASPGPLSVAEAPPSLLPVEVLLGVALLVRVLAREALPVVLLRATELFVEARLVRALPVEARLVALLLPLLLSEAPESPPVTAPPWPPELHPRHAAISPTVIAPEYESHRVIASSSEHDRRV
jgi:hypothetical protein